MSWGASGTVVAQTSFNSMAGIRFRGTLQLKLRWSHVERLSSIFTPRSTAGFLQVFRVPPVLTLDLREL